MDNKLSEHAKKLEAFAESEDGRCQHCSLSPNDFFHNEKWFQKIFEHSPIGIAVLQIPEQKFLIANKSFLEMVGYSEEELMKMFLEDITHPEDWAVEHEYIDDCLASHRSNFSFEKRYIRKDGQIIHVSVVGDILPTADGTVVAIGMVTDITECIKAREELLLNEARLECLLRINNFNAANIQELLDFSLQEAISLTGSKIGYIFFYDENKQQFSLNSWSQDVMENCRIAEPQTIYDLEKTGLWGDAVRLKKPVLINDFSAPGLNLKGVPEGHVNLERFLSIPVFSEGKIVAVVGVANKAEEYNESDIRQLNLMMSSVWQIIERRKNLENERMLAEMIDIAPSSITIHDINGNFLFSNQKTLALHGYTKKEFMNINLNQLDAPESASLLPQRFATIEKFGEARFEVDHLRKDGTTFPLEIYVRKITWSNQPAFLSIGTDISDRKKAETELKKREALLNKIFDLLPIGIWFADAHGNLLRGNPAGIEIWGAEPKVGIEEYGIFSARHLPSGTPVNPEDWALNKAILKGITTKEELLEIDAFDGKRKIILNYSAPVYDDAGNLLGAVVMNNDITERRRTEDAVQKMQKLDSLGILAGGIAHDFNNLLCGIYGFIDVALTVAKDETTRKYLQKAMDTLERSKALTHQLLTFAKGGAPVQKVGAIFPCVQDAAQFALSGSNVSCNFEIPDNLWNCFFDKNQIGQVIDNLVINALQAMPVGGKITLSAANVVLTEAEHPILKPGKYVRISIKDRGIGIPREILPRIFDPFFTTKAKGHGLGLATCYSIISRHGGCIDVQSVPGKGSTFQVYLPATEEKEAQENKLKLAEHRGSGTVLVMDDEELMLEIFKDVLESLGYDVVCMRNGKDTVEFYANELKAGRQLAAMIFDLTIPGEMGGLEAISLVRKMNLEVPVFVASGYADDPVMRSPSEYGFTASICKPFRRQQLVEMLLKNLESAGK